MAAILESLLADERICLFDVGARAGVDSRWDRFRTQLEVVAFEPDPTECARLNRTPALGHPARFLPHALWREQAEDVPFYVCAWPVASSLYPPNPDFLAGYPEQAALLRITEERTIRTTTLDRVCASEGLTPDCLKIDVEGAELDVLLGGEQALASSLILDLEVEFVELFRGQPLFADLDLHLRQRGWQLLGLRRNAWRHANGRAEPGFGGQLVSADALYFNRAALEQGLSRERALKMVVALAAYRQLDLAFHLLETPPLAGLGVDERARFERLLAPPPGVAGRIASRLFGRVNSERRRAFVDSLQAADATVWQDPSYF